MRVGRGAAGWEASGRGTGPQVWTSRPLEEDESRIEVFAIEEKKALHSVHCRCVDRHSSDQQQSHAKPHKAPLKDKAQDTDHKQATTKSNNKIKNINQSYKGIVQKTGECGGMDPPESFSDGNPKPLIATEAAPILISLKL